MLQGSKHIEAGTVISDISVVFKGQKIAEAIHMVPPARIQAPVDLQHDDSDFTTGVTKDSYRKTICDMIVPYGKEGASKNMLCTRIDMGQHVTPMQSFTHNAELESTGSKRDSNIFNSIMVIIV